MREDLQVGQILNEQRRQQQPNPQRPQPQPPFNLNALHLDAVAGVLIWHNPNRPANPPAPVQDIRPATLSVTAARSA